MFVIYPANSCGDPQVCYFLLRWFGALQCKHTYNSLRHLHEHVCLDVPNWYCIRNCNNLGCNRKYSSLHGHSWRVAGNDNLNTGFSKKMNLIYLQTFLTLYTYNWYFVGIGSRNIIICLRIWDHWKRKIQTKSTGIGTAALCNFGIFLINACRNLGWVKLSNLCMQMKFIMSNEDEIWNLSDIFVSVVDHHN